MKMNLQAEYIFALALTQAQVDSEVIYSWKREYKWCMLHELTQLFPLTDVHFAVAKRRKRDSMYAGLWFAGTEDNH